MINKSLFSYFLFIFVPSFFLVTRELFSFYDFVRFYCCLYLTFFNKVWSDARSYFLYLLRLALFLRIWSIFKVVSCCTKMKVYSLAFGWNVLYLLGSYDLLHLLVPAFLCLVFICPLVIIGIKIFHYQCLCVYWWSIDVSFNPLIIRLKGRYVKIYFCGFFLRWVCSGLINILD